MKMKKILKDTVTVLDQTQSNAKLINHILDLSPTIQGLTEEDALNLHSFKQALRTVYEVNIATIESINCLLGAILDDPETESLIFDNERDLVDMLR